jgi:hypothetical protein
MIMDLNGADGQPAGAEDLWSLADRASMTDWFLTTANVALITSQVASWHTVNVTLELWDGHSPTTLNGSGLKRHSSTPARASSELWELKATPPEAPWTCVIKHATGP